MLSGYLPRQHFQFFYLICSIVFLTALGMLTVLTPKIEVLIVLFTGPVQHWGIPSIPFAIPSTEPTVAPLQSVSKPVSTAIQTDFPSKQPQALPVHAPEIFDSRLSALYTSIPLWGFLKAFIFESSEGSVYLYPSLCFAFITARI